MLALAHREVQDFGGVITNSGHRARPTRSRVIKAAYDYGRSFKLKRSLIAQAFDQEKKQPRFKHFNYL